MNTLKQLQEKGEEEFENEFGRYLSYVDDVQGWGEYFTPFTSYRIKDFLHQQTTLAYNVGYNARTKETNYGKAMYERGRADERKECAKIVRDYIINDWSGEAEVYSEIEEIAKKIESNTNII